MIPNVPKLWAEAKQEQATQIYYLLKDENNDYLGDFEDNNDCKITVLKRHSILDKQYGLLSFEDEVQEVYAALYFKPYLHTEMTKDLFETVKQETFQKLTQNRFAIWLKQAKLHKWIKTPLAVVLAVCYLPYLIGLLRKNWKTERSK